MTTFLKTGRLTSFLALLVLTACSPKGYLLQGDPRNPYPRPTPPKVGEIVHLRTGTLVTPEQMLAVAGDARVVYVGETHDNPASHRLELQLLEGLAGLHPGRQALGMEMFPRSQQQVLDRWVEGKLDEKTFLKEVRWFENWKMDFAHYRDLLTFARDRQIPIIALNAEKSFVKAVRSKSPDQLSAEEKAQLPELDLTDPYQRALATAIFGDRSHGGLDREGFIRAQTVWDETMAESVARYLSSPAGREKHLLVVAGDDHIRSGIGIPRRVFRRLPVSYVLIGGDEIHIPTELQDRLMDVELPRFPIPPYDFIAYVAYEKQPQTGVRLGVAIAAAEDGRGIVVKSVVPGSVAERVGLQSDDLLLALDGEPLTQEFDLIYALQQKHPGDRVTLRLERQGAPLSMEVLFPAAGTGPAK